MKNKVMKSALLAVGARLSVGALEAPKFQNYSAESPHL
jgi:hypothetical protein